MLTTDADRLTVTTGVGAYVGDPALWLGRSVGFPVGLRVRTVGSAVGRQEGKAVGFNVGRVEGELVGDVDGHAVGLAGRREY